MNFIGAASCCVLYPQMRGIFICVAAIIYYASRFTT